MNTIQRHSGMFRPGQSGNPSGRPKADVAIRDIARQFTDKAIQTLVEISQNPKSPDAARVQAANALLDRGWGKPHQYSESVNVKAGLYEFLDHVAAVEFSGKENSNKDLIEL